MSDDFPTQDAAKRPRRWPKVLLAVSLVMNLLVLGAITGAHLRDGRAPGGPGFDRTALHSTGFAPFFAALPHEARGEIGEALRRRGEAARPDRAALEAEFARIIAALKAEPFERAALETVMAAQQARVSARVEAGRAALLDVLAGMSPAERSAFAERMEDRMARGDRKR
ncbi:periplasmic heavy metal sensor [Maritimibacter sp. HL-12]|jgi:uncharacterized membrane protein|uniref:periplasmic heavy metal sensor n=1 Tax=Maritimibacter sp. HL-12 TaxID=1162418 RepID=UPI000A0F1031|nr:periplasmic heavy metal sensor [Maritimibacter sp. HL-12]SMH33047.1 Heavy-metal resistance [Maritimibacter sp. HL-12]